MNICEKKVASKTSAKLGDLTYGTVIKYNGTYYIKVNKHKIGNGINVNYTRGHSVLFNPKLATLREISGDCVVEVYEAEMAVELTGCAINHIK